MNKQEILDEINKTKEHLANREKMLEECEYERWKPKDFELYWYVNSRCESACSHFCLTYKVDTDRYQNFNCFQSHEQAQAEAEKILVRRMLEDIARRLNKGKKINWNDNRQCKCYLRYNIIEDKVDIDFDFNAVRIGVTYCLNIKFRETAIQEIGEERLKKYLRGE